MKQFLILMVAFLVWGCGGAEKKVGASENSTFANEYAGAPQWVQTKACSTPPVATPGKTLCGVASHPVRAAHLMNVAHRSAMADASAQIALSLKSKVETLERTYAGEYAQGVEDEAADADSKSSTITVRWSKLQMAGVRALETWISPNNNYYVLAVVDADTAMAALKQFDALTTTQKRLIDSHEAELMDLLESKTD